MPRFDADRTTVTRIALALAGVVAVGIISLGIKDYVQQKKSQSESTSAPTVAYANTKTAGKKTTSASAKIRRARGSATEANAAAVEQAAAENMENSLTSEEFPRAGAKTMRVMGSAPNTERAQAAYQEVEAAMDGDNPVRREFHGIKSCVPLPNGTRPRDPDATYYQNWAREYSCLF